MQLTLADGPHDTCAFLFRGNAREEREVDVGGEVGRAGCVERAHELFRRTRPTPGAEGGARRRGGGGGATVGQLRTE